MTCSGKSAGCILIVCGKEGGRGKGGEKETNGTQPQWKRLYSALDAWCTLFSHEFYTFLIIWGGLSMSKLRKDKKKN